METILKQKKNIKSWFSFLVSRVCVVCVLLCVFVKFAGSFSFCFSFFLFFFSLFLIQFSPLGIFFYFSVLCVFFLSFSTGAIAICKLQTKKKTTKLKLGGY